MQTVCLLVKHAKSMDVLFEPIEAYSLDARLRQMTKVEAQEREWFASTH